jgi:hypothetical protein
VEEKRLSDVYKIQYFVDENVSLKSSPSPLTPAEASVDRINNNSDKG